MHERVLSSWAQPTAALGVGVACEFYFEKSTSVEVLDLHVLSMYLTNE